MIDVYTYPFENAALGNVFYRPLQRDKRFPTSLPEFFEPTVPEPENQSTKPSLWRPVEAVRRLMNNFKVDGLTRALTRQLYILYVLGVSLGLMCFLSFS